MTSWVVADSGIFLATVLNESQSQQADTIINYWIDEDIQVAVPHYFAMKSSPFYEKMSIAV